MTTAFLAPSPPVFDRIRHTAPQLTVITTILVLAALPLLFAMAVDNRSFQGEGIWMKPLKFHAALAIYTGSRPAIWATAAGYTAVTLAAYVQALMGLPLI